MNVPMPPEKKLDYLRDQIMQVRAGLLTFLTCPYCGEARDGRDSPLKYTKTVQDKVN